MSVIVIGGLLGLAGLVLGGIASGNRPQAVPVPVRSNSGNRRRR